MTGNSTFLIITTESKVSTLGQCFLENFSSACSNYRKLVWINNPDPVDESSFEFLMKAGIKLQNKEYFYFNRISVISDKGKVNRARKKFSIY
jgi:hypothetical protein